MNSKGENAVERKRRQLEAKETRLIAYIVDDSPGNRPSGLSDDEYDELLEELAFVQMQLRALRGYQVENAEKT